MEMKLALVLAAIIGCAVASDHRVCTYRNDACTNDEECDRANAGVCEDVDVDGGSVWELGFIVDCDDQGVATYKAYFDEDCDGQADQTGTVTNSDCTRFVGRNIWFQIDCDPDVCFSSSSTVKLADGTVKTLDEVRVGDAVESFDAAGRRTFSTVFLIQHEGAQKLKGLRKIEYVVDTTQTRGSVMVSPRHLVRGAKSSDAFIPASKLSVGATIFVMAEGATEGVEAEVVAVSSVSTPVRNVHTMNDRVVVDGVMASSMLDFGPFPLLRGALIPIKALYYLGLHDVVSAIDDVLHRVATNAAVARLLKA